MQTINHCLDRFGLRAAHWIIGKLEYWAIIKDQIVFNIEPIVI
jgi:hypothetical protein